MTQNRELRFTPAKELRVASDSNGQRSLSGYAAVFNALSVDMGGWQEVIAPGAFTKSLMSPDLNCVCLRDHDNSILLGRTRSKTLTLEQDATGLKFNCNLPATSQASDLIALIERGDIDGCSFSFVCQLDDWKTTPDGQTIRTVIEADLFDVSAVSEPAYPDTSLSLRNAPIEIRSAIESRKTKRDDSDDVEEDSIKSDCTCPCDPCVDGDCSECTDDDCSCVDCLCDSAEMNQRNRAHMLVELAKLRK